MGLTFLTDTAYLLPLTAFFLVVSVGALGFRANRRRGYRPLAVGILAGIALLFGKFVVDSNVAVYGSIPFLIAASIWNAWPVRAATGVSGTPAGTLHQIGSIGKEIQP